MTLEVSEFRRLDINYRYYNGSLQNLMEQAGRAVASTITKKYNVGNNILFLCGTGNKAGDGLVAAELLREENNVKVLFVDDEKKVNKEDAIKALDNYKGEISSMADLEKEIKKAEVIVDALLGTGMTGSPRPPYDEVIRLINESGKDRKVSIDLPSGFGTSIAVKPDITVTFHDIKQGMTQENSGEIEVTDIGIPQDLEGVSGPGDLAYLPDPDPHSHKGMNGVLGIIGGWTYHGSAALSALGALAVAPDLVNIIVPPDRYDLISSFSPEIVVRPYVGLDKLISDLDRYDALVIGPGLGMDKEIRKMLLKLMAQVNIPAVIDADAVRLLAGEEQLFSGKQLVFTPHSKEFEALTGSPASMDALKTFTQRTRTVGILKGYVDYISDGNEIFRTEGGNSRLSMGGTGDLLAGVIGGLLAKGMNTVAASRLGTFIMKKTASNLFEEKAYWYSVMDLIGNIPATMKEMWDFSRH